ncbi:membrane protein insertase YidC [Desulfovibrio ferrophilus]|uniref:Membrane protein insertase YidC n=1 Tax=Desulfovibrio ferrophilus TaxID=241368 RepID=A0A2Z6B0S4_9BACT|nr:membrane protein insertase YidC [Desulfovibrio ferrophilus]BBD09084.1 membrane protein insertase YidC [Desulfovibrio ferrophilus]
MDNDNTKRTLIAIGLSTLILLGWTYFFSPQPQPAQAPAEQAATMQNSPATASVPAEPKEAPAFVPVDGQDVVVETPLFKAVLNSAGGILTDFELKNYTTSIEPGAPQVNLVSSAAMDKGLLGILWNGQGSWRSGQWAAPEQTRVTVSEGDETNVTFSGVFGGLAIVRTLTFKADSYLIKEDIALTNTSTTPISGRLGFTLASKPLTHPDDRYNMTRVSWLDAEGTDNENDREDLGAGVSRLDGVGWGAIQSNYFVLAVAPEAGNLAMHAKYAGDLFRIQMDKENIDLAQGTQVNVGNNYYLGPISENFLAGTPNGLESIVTYGFFDVLAKPLLQLLNFLYGMVGNWGVAIILLTVIIKIVFWPLSNKSYKSMNKMKKIQPLMAKVREQYKDDRQKMNEEMMRLYKTYKVNPAGGCLPMMMQIPVFFGLYQALLGAIELRHASFIAHVPFTDIVWLADLSAKDPFYVTPLIMGASMFLQQKMTPSPGDPTQAKVMLFMPVIFTFLFLNFPSGLVVYWMVNNVLSIAQQWMLTRDA